MKIDREQLAKEGFVEYQDNWWEKWNDFSGMMTQSHYCGSWFAVKMDEPGLSIHALTFWSGPPPDDIHLALKKEAHIRLHMNIYYHELRRAAEKETA